MKPGGVIVIGGYINGLGIVRSFAARKIRTAVILTKSYDLAQYSRHVAASESALDLVERPETLMEALGRRSSLWKGWALFPSNDEALAAIVECREQLEAQYPILTAPNENLRYFLDKDRMLQAAGDVGIPVPTCYGPAVSATADRSDLRFPVIVKPLASFRFHERFGRKVLVAANLQELKQAIVCVEGAGIPCQVFDIVPGADNRIYCQCLYVDAEGVPRADILVRKIRQSPPFFGVSRVSEIVPPNRLLYEATLELLRRIGFRGIAVAEYKLDPRDGTYRFLEVNGRSVLYNSLLRRAGVDLAALAWSDYVEGRLETIRPMQWPGVWINLHADLLYSALRGRDENLTLKGFLSPYRRPIIEAVWSPRDPQPFLVQWARTLRQGARRFVGRC